MITIPPDKMSVWWQLNPPPFIEQGGRITTPGPWHWNIILKQANKQKRNKQKASKLPTNGK